MLCYLILDYITLHYIILYYFFSVSCFFFFLLDI